MDRYESTKKVGVLGILGNIFLLIIKSYIGIISNNILLESNRNDHRNDCIVTTFTLLSGIFSYVNVYWFDGVVGSGICI